MSGLYLLKYLSSKTPFSASALPASRLKTDPHFCKSALVISGENIFFTVKHLFFTVESVLLDFYMLQD